MSAASLPTTYSPAGATNVANDATTAGFAFGILGTFTDGATTPCTFIITSEDISPSDKRDITTEQLGRVIHERIVERVWTIKLTLIGPKTPVIKTGDLEGILTYGGYTWDCDPVAENGGQGVKKTFTISGHRSTLWPLTNSPDEVTDAASVTY